jgi:hypothetical protein
MRLSDGPVVQTQDCLNDAVQRCGQLDGTGAATVSTLGVRILMQLYGKGRVELFNRTGEDHGAARGMLLHHASIRSPLRMPAQQPDHLGQALCSLAKSCRLRLPAERSPLVSFVTRDCSTSRARRRSRTLTSSRSVGSAGATTLEPGAATRSLPLKRDSSHWRYLAKIDVAALVSSPKLQGGSISTQYANPIYASLSDSPRIGRQPSVTIRVHPRVWRLLPALSIARASVIRESSESPATR